MIHLGNYRHLDLVISNKFHPFDMILEKKYSFKFKKESFDDLPELQHTPFAAHRPFDTVEQAALLIEHGMRLRFSVEHWRTSDECPIRQPALVQQIDGP